MLLARGQKQLAAGHLRWVLSFSTRVWSIAVAREGLVLDTRFIPPAAEEARPRSCLYLLVDGTWDMHPAPGEAEVPRFEGPCALLVSDVHLEGAVGERPFTFRATGQPYRAIEIHVREGDMKRLPERRPTPVALHAQAWSAAREVVRLEGHDDESFARALGSLLEELAKGDLLRPEVVEHAVKRPPRSFSLLWGALRPMIESLYLNPTLQEVEDKTGVSTRQLDRYIQSFVSSFGLVGERWRSTTRHFRLKLAVIFLSAEGASVAEVANAVGYGSSDAMARAFRDANMPPPATVQEQLRAAG